MQNQSSDHLVKTPTNACRIPIFAPTRRPMSVKSFMVSTSWGSATITGRLGQQHRDLLDAARMVAEREEETDDGRIHLLVDPAKLRSAIGGESINTNLIKSWLIDLMQAIVEVKINNPDIVVTGGLISEVVDATVEPPKTRAGAFREGRRYLRISFGTGWSKLISSDYSTHYPIRQVVSLKHGFSQAVARFCWSHHNVNESISSLAEKLAASGRIRDLRRNIHDDVDGLAKIGIDVDGDKITRKSASKAPVEWKGREQNPGGREQSPGGREQSPGENALSQSIQ